MASPRNQAEGREWRDWRDVHGRRWGCIMDTKCKGGPAPAGPFEYQEYQHRRENDCVAPFRPPWLPEQDYLRPVKGRYDLLGIDYERMLKDQRRSHKLYEEQCMEVAAVLDVEYEPGQPVPAKVVRVAGKAPRPLEPIVAAMQGNRWILGMTDVPHPGLAKLLAPPKTDTEDFLTQFSFGDEGAESEDEMEEWPQPHGVGRWRLSDGTLMQGKRDAAREAQAALLAAA